MRNFQSRLEPKLLDVTHAGVSQFQSFGSYVIKPRLTYSATLELGAEAK